MNGLSGEQLLQVWERSRELPVQEVALLILMMACPDRTRTDLATLPLNQRDALLLDVRCATLRRCTEGFAVCPACGVQLEFKLDAAELAKQLRMQPKTSGTTLPGVSLRPVNTLDLMACAKAINLEQARFTLLARTCLLEGDEANLAQFRTSNAMHTWLEKQPRESLDALLQQFDIANAACELRLEMNCSACNSTQLLDMDIPSFVLRELCAEARRLMNDIHELAVTHGWSESTILAMSPARRTAYLEMQNA